MTSPFDDYRERLSLSGEDKREAVKRRADAYLSRKFGESLSYKEVDIDGYLTALIVLSTEEMNVKKIRSMPGEDLPHGGLVYWAENYWLITEIDADNELYSKGTMTQCNFILKWKKANGDIVERWSIVEDGTKYLIGEKTQSIMSIGDARLAVTVGRDEETVNINRGMRFVIDDPDTSEPLVYQVTKPNKKYNVYNGRGVLRFIMNEVNSTEFDNMELRIADYHSPTGKPTAGPPANATGGVWI